jgi:8-oxo-dGTP pyrophosphatase MutT (NUDIX family)
MTAAAIGQSSTGAPNIVPRLGARILLLDPTDRVLLLQAHDPVEPFRRWWELPGGGIQPGESTIDTCRRELAEETGIHLRDVGPCVWIRESRFRFRGQHYYRRDWIHVAHLPQQAESLEPTQLTDNEQEILLDERWWSAKELAAATTQWFLPRRLPELLPAILAGHYTDHPLELNE